MLEAQGSRVCLQGWRNGKKCQKILVDRISANTFRENYSFLNLALCTVTLVTVHKNAETIQGRKLFAEMRYLKTIMC